MSGLTRVVEFLEPPCPRPRWDFPRESPREAISTEKKVRVPQRAIPIKVRDQERTKLDVPLSSYNRVHAEVSKFGDLGNEKEVFDEERKWGKAVAFWLK